MKQLLAIISKLPNIHTIHDRVTAVYNAWLSVYALLHKLGLATGGQLTPDQAAAVMSADFAAGAARRAEAQAPAPAAAVPVPPAAPAPADELTDTDYMRASGLIE